jgi:hypothetical protein
MSILSHGKPAPYHTAAGEADRLRTIIAMYADDNDPAPVARARATLAEHLRVHPELERT